MTHFRRALMLLAAVSLILAGVAATACSIDQGLLPIDGQVGRAYASPRSTDPSPFAFQPDPVVATMIAGVTQADVYSLGRALTGESVITVGGQPHTLQTRNTYSAGISTATGYVYEYLQARGLAASYHYWEEYTGEGEKLAYANVVGQLDGTVRPGEIVLITAHLDDLPEGPRAPGADDNASGSVAVMTAAARLAGHEFERTVRFVLFTGEEQGLLGSEAYADDCDAADENIVAVLNLDMIGWDGNDDGYAYLETRRTGSSGYAQDAAIANVFIQVVDDYGLSGALAPEIDPCYDSEVDSWSFWAVGYPSVTAIEDFDGEELNPNYHTVDDELSTLNPSFFTAYVKAVVGTAAHLAIPVFDRPYAIYLPLTWKW